MQLIRGIHNLKTKHRPSVVSIGNYDGVHLGHQSVIQTLLTKSAELGAPSTVITFEPLAKEFFSPGSVPRIYSIEQRAEQLFKLGVDRVLCIDFNKRFASFSPQKFVGDILVRGLGVKYLCVGDDFRFGKNREGDFEFLKIFGNQQGFSVTAHDTFMLDGARVSSGRVRMALNAGDFKLAEKLLGRPYTIKGQVSVGRQVGRTINFPTANIILNAPQAAVQGVFAVSTSIEGGNIINGVANVGTRPTVEGTQNRLEVHLFDFDRDIYDQQIEVRFIHKLRSEQKFESLDELKNQIQKDCDAAREHFEG